MKLCSRALLSGGLQGVLVSIAPPRPTSHWSPAAILCLQKDLWWCKLFFPFSLHHEHSWRLSHDLSSFWTSQSHLPSTDEVFHVVQLLLVHFESSLVLALLSSFWGSLGFLTGLTSSFAAISSCGWLSAPYLNSKFVQVSPRSIFCWTFSAYNRATLQE